MTKQQRIERHYFELFRNAYGLLDGEVEYGDKPDVIINGARRLGIEITNFYLQEGTLTSSEQIQARWRDSVASEAQRLYLSRDGKNVEFSFGFDKTHPIEDVKTVAGEIAELTLKLAGRSNGQIPRKEYRHIEELDFMHLLSGHLKYSDDPVPGFPNGEPDVSKDHLQEDWMEWRNRRETRALAQGIYEPLAFEAKWRVIQAHSFGLMPIERLEEIVRTKETKVEEYSHCDAYWLLVVVDSMNAAQEQDIRVDDVSLVSDSFERVIVYKPVFEHVVPIIPQRSANNRGMSCSRRAGEPTPD